jgi:hypothetical protein
MRFITIFLIAICSICNCYAQVDESAFVKKSFIIIKSTKSYTEAKAFAIKASKDLKIKLDLRDLKPNKESGLTWNKKECETNGWDYPCYVARGRYDDGDYVSIEWSEAFAKFAKGYYIVIVYSGNKKEATTSLKKVKKLFKEAYAKEADVYIGCMH